MNIWCRHRNLTTPRKDELGEYCRCLECAERIPWSWPDPFPIRPPQLTQPPKREHLQCGMAAPEGAAQSLLLQRWFLDAIDSGIAFVDGPSSFFTEEDYTMATEPSFEGEPLKDVLASFARKYLEETLRKNRGDLRQSAEALGLSAHALKKIVRKYHLEGSSKADELVH